MLFLRGGRACGKSKIIFYWSFHWSQALPMINIFYLVLYTHAGSLRHLSPFGRATCPNQNEWKEKQKKKNQKKGAVSNEWEPNFKARKRLDKQQSLLNELILHLKFLVVLILWILGFLGSLLIIYCNEDFRKKYWISKLLSVKILQHV